MSTVTVFFNLPFLKAVIDPSNAPLALLGGGNDVVGGAGGGGDDSDGGGGGDCGGATGGGGGGGEVGPWEGAIGGGGGDDMCGGDVGVSPSVDSSVFKLKFSIFF